jgi:hypothetical protein
MCIPALVLPTCSSEEETMKHSRTSALIAIAAVTASSLVACKNNKEAAAMDSAAGRVDSAAVMDSAKRTDSINATARSGWTEPSILGFAAAANAGEIQLAQLGVKKATNAKVKAYARVGRRASRTAAEGNRWPETLGTADTAGRRSRSHESRPRRGQGLTERPRARIGIRISSTR